MLLGVLVLPVPAISRKNEVVCSLDKYYIRYQHSNGGEIRFFDLSKANFLTESAILSLSSEAPFPWHEYLLDSRVIDFLVSSSAQKQNEWQDQSSLRMSSTTPYGGTLTSQLETPSSTVTDMVLRDRANSMKE